MKKDKMNEVCSLAVEFVQEFKELPVDDYMRIKLIMLEDNKTTVTQANEGQGTPQTNERMFTQDEVNRIVQDRLARVKVANEPDQRELDLQSRELALYARERIEENGLDKTLADELKGMDKATIDKCLKILAPYAKKASEPILNAVGPTAGGAQSESDAIRKAMGLK